MQSLEELKQGFHKLSLEDQKQKLINLLTKIKDKHEVFGLILKELPSNPRVDREFCEGVYSDIMGFAYNLHKFREQKEMNKLTDLQKKLKKLHEQEEKEKIEENPDSLLENL